MLATSSRGPALREGIRLITGADNHPMLYDPLSGRYIRLSALGAEIVSLLDGSKSQEDLVDLLMAVAPQNQERIRESVRRFLTDLAGAGILQSMGQSVAPPPRRMIDGILAARAPRLVLVRNLDKVACRLATPFTSVPTSIVLASLAGAVVLATAAVFMALLSPADLVSTDSPSTLIVLVFISIHILFHETSHLVACGSVGAPVREAGIMFWLGILPMAYIDHTDSYRLAPRHQRVRIALAGPAFDVLAAGVTALVIISGPASWVGDARLLLFAQLTMLAFNCNPLLPTDCYYALSALSGEISLRRRALHLLFLLVSRERLPAHLGSLSRRQRFVYVGYGALSSAYVIVILFFMARGVLTFLGH